LCHYGQELAIWELYRYIKTTATDKSWMYLLSLVCLVVNYFIRNIWLKLFNIGILIWFLLLAIDLLFKIDEIYLLMAHSRPMANVKKIAYCFMAFSALPIVFIFSDRFLLAAIITLVNFFFYFFLAVIITESNIRVFLNRRRD
jgi:hypothetical protein